MRKGSENSPFLFDNQLIIGVGVMLSLRSVRNIAILQIWD